MDTLSSRGVPSGTAQSVARSMAETVTGNADSRTPTGDGPTAVAMRDAMSAVRMNFAEANKWVFYGMAIALGIGYLCALRHPGGRAQDRAEEKPARDPLER